jgi:hypothetical protein
VSEVSWSKRQFVTQAFEEAGLASYVYDLTPQQTESALRRLDAMLASWNTKGLRLGYPLPGAPDNADLDDLSGVPDAANEAIYLNLAIRLCPAFGKTAAPELRLAAKQSYDALLSRAMQPQPAQLPAMPAGAGNRGLRAWNRAFLPGPEQPITAGPDGPLEFS